MNYDHVYDDRYVNKTEKFADDIVLWESPTTLSNNEYIFLSDTENGEYREDGDAGDDTIATESPYNF